MTAAVLRRYAALFVVLLVAGCGRQAAYAPQDGDIVFQTSRSGQSQAIQLATGSPWSHLGIVFLQDGHPFVFEAVGPVRATALDTWIARGEGGRFVAKRLRDAETRLTPAALDSMRAVGESMRGRPYDLGFAWSDDRIYCSELVWKIYRRALGLDIGTLETIGDLDLTSPAVQAKMRERWGDAIPLQEPVISPARMFASPLLVTVHGDRAAEDAAPEGGRR